MNHLPLGRGLLLISLALAWFALVPQARAVCQEGCDLSIGNTFLGDDALILNTTGLDNTAVGFNALFSNTTGSYNTPNGFVALQSNTTGTFNTANGRDALSSNTAGGDNTAVGVEALFSNTTGNQNTATGALALFFNTIGGNNTADGFDALLNNTTGNSNIAVGTGAGQNLTTGNNNIDIGNKGVAGESNTIRIGKQGRQTTTAIAGISGATVAGGVGVLIDTNGRLGTTTSSARYKDNIQPMDKASEAILALKPVTFHYKKDIDPDGIPQFGLVAEQVEKVNSDLVARDDDGKPYSVRYEAVNAMLLNEFLKAHRKGEQQDRKIEELEARVAQLQSALKEQDSKIQKVSLQLELRNPAPQVADNDQ